MREDVGALVSGAYQLVGKRTDLGHYKQDGYDQREAWWEISGLTGLGCVGGEQWEQKTEQAVWEKTTPHLLQQAHKVMGRRWREAGQRKMSAKGSRQEQRPLEGRWLARLGPRAHHFAITEVPGDDPESEGKCQVIFNGYNFKSTNIFGKC